MVVQRTAKTKVVTAVTMYSGYYFVQVLALDWTLNSVFTIGCGAPFEVLAIVDVGSSEERLVPGVSSAKVETDSGGLNIPISQIVGYEEI